MPHYFMLLDARWFHEQVRPALSASWRQRSFGPCRPVCAQLLAKVRDDADRCRVSTAELILTQVADGRLSFERHVWRCLVGELLLLGADELPQCETPTDAFCCLLDLDFDPEAPAERQRFAPIQQALFGSRDLVFGGGIYRPDHAGFNDCDDVARLTTYLLAIDPSQWTPADLARLRHLPESERTEELEFAREWFAPLAELYRNAQRHDQIVVCEAI